MSRVNTSVLWDFFTKTNPISDKKAKCTVCGDIYSYKGSTGNLKAHLKKKHVDIYRRVVTVQSIQRQDAETPQINMEGLCSPLPAPAPSSSTSEPAPSTSASVPAAPSISASLSAGSTALGRPLTTSIRFQQTIDRYSTQKKISKETKQKIDNDLLRLFTHSFQPFALVEEEPFKKFASWIPGYKLPSRKTVSSVMIPALHEKTKEAVKNGVRFDGEIICLTSDLWTSRANESYLAITGHYVTEDFKIKSVLLYCGSFEDAHTSENIHTALAKMAEEWNIADKINFVVTDNAANITRAVRDMGWKHYGCYAHTLNLIIQDTLKILQPLLEKIKKIVRHFKTSSTALAKLLKAQTTENPDCIPKRLKQEVPTRWNSAYYMLQRFVELESHVRSTIAILRQDLPIISNEEWVWCAELCKILKPFDDATTSMSGQSYMTASSVIVLTRCLISSCDKLLAENFCEASMNIIYQLRTGLVTRFTNVERSGTFSVCTFLDPRYKSSVFSDPNEARNTRKRVQDMLADAISKEMATASAPEPTANRNQSHDKFSPWSVLQDIVSQQQTVGTPLSKAIKEIDTYLNEDNLPVFKKDGSWNCPLGWWRDHKYTYPNLSKLFKKYGNIMATSVPCERIFSKTGLIVSDRRTRLTTSKVEQLTFLNANL